MKNKLFKIISICLAICTIFTLCSCEKNAKEENYTADGVYQGDTKKVLRDLIESSDRTMDKFLSIDDTTRYNPVGSISGETLYAFNDVSYIELIRSLSSRMDTNVISQELYLRGFYLTENNIMFVTNPDFIKRQKLYLTEFTYFSALEEESVITTFPMIEERINFFKEQGYKELYYYKTLLTSAEKVSETNENNQYEVVYVLGRNKEGFKILDAVYTINGKVEQQIKQPHLSKEMIVDFTPNLFTPKPKTEIENIENNVNVETPVDGNVNELPTDTVTENTNNESQTTE